MTSSDAVTNVFHDSLCLSNLLVKRIDLKLCVSQNLKKMLCLIIYRVYKMFDWFAGDGFRCSSALCLFFEFLLFFGVIPLFHFSQFSIYQGYEIADHDSQYIKQAQRRAAAETIARRPIDYSIHSMNN